MKTTMKQRSFLEFHILSGEASREVLSRGGDQRRVMGSQHQTWTRDEEVAIAVETSSVCLGARKFRTGPSTGKVMATIFWDLGGILLVDFLSPVIRSTVTGRPNSCGNWRMTSGTSDRTLTSRTSPFVTTTRVFIHTGHGRETCETGMDGDSSPAVQHWFGVIRLPPVRTTEGFPPWPVFHK